MPGCRGLSGLRGRGLACPPRVQAKPSERERPGPGSLRRHPRRRSFLAARALRPWDALPPLGRLVAMRINQNTALQGKQVTLVPYTSVHVQRYHEWMKSEELRRLTASEPLSLEQEYKMQCSWREDTNKCTFIILDREKWSRQSATEEDSMVGDVNLFLTDAEDPTLGEIEVMIADSCYRGRGFGKEATLIMMSYGMAQLGLLTFEAKIGLENEASISMFKKLHFKEVGVNSVFDEVILRLTVDDQEREWLLEQTSHVEGKSYNVVKLQNRACSS